MTSTLATPRARALAPGPPPGVVAQRLGTPDLAGVPDFLCETADVYGPIAALELAHKPYYLLSDPEAVRHVLVTQARSFRKGRGTDAVHDVLGDGLFTSEPPRHTAQRRLLQPRFHHEQVAGLGNEMAAQAQGLVDTWKQHEVIDIGRAMRRLTLRIGAATLFSAALDDRVDAVGEALTAVMVHASAGIFGRLRERPSRSQAQLFHAARERLHAIANELIAQHRKTPADERADLFDMLAAARDENGAAPSDAHLRNEVLTLLLAAAESTSIALTWALHLLATHPQVQRRLQEELDAVVGERACAADDCHRLPYTSAVFKEALRLFPPAWILGRRAIEPVCVSGVELPRGAAVYISPYVLHRSARWYRDASTFLPERWLETNELPRFAYLPFGGGTRGCIGEPFAWMEGTIVLATVARRFALASADDAPVHALPLLTLRPSRPIRLRVALRPHSSSSG